LIDESKDGHVITWAGLQHYASLTDDMIEQCKRYYELLVEWQPIVNLTALAGLEQVIPYHFQDSLALAQFLSMDKIRSIADVGTGGGFPAIPLKIAFPHVSVVLIEVNEKKIDFLRTVIQELALENTIVSPLDWRTFLRTTMHDVDLFVARASLHPDELVRMFKSGCRYNNAQLIYWASQEWKPGVFEQPYVEKEYAYTVGARQRRYIFFKKLF
jgi:16S rRNA (guanine(527)-N(7))-methyltransferase RsmG